MRSPDLLLGIIDELGAGRPEGNVALRQLLKIASTDGLLASELQLVIDVIFDSNVSGYYKNILASECLIPQGDYLLSSDIIGRILGAVGTPELYYKNGKQHKLKRLPISCQQLLLKWLICALPFFGREVFRLLKRNIPILYGLLSYEFLRPFISTLIVAATSGPDAVPKISSGTLIRSWHVQLVAELSSKFPLDPSLKALIEYFRTRSRTLEVQLSAKLSGLKNLNISGVFRYPNAYLHAEILAKYQSLRSISNQVNDVNSQLQRLFESLDMPKLKKRKTGELSYDLVTSETSTVVSIQSINSISSLVAQLENIGLTNPSSVLSVTTVGNSKLRSLYLAMHLLVAGNGDQTVKKLDYAIRYHILHNGDHNSVFIFSQLLEFARFQGLRGLTAPCIHFINSSDSGETEHLRKQIKLLRFLSWEKSVLVTAIVKIIFQIKKYPHKKQDWNELVGLLNVEIAFMIIKWSGVFRSRSNYTDFLGCLLEILSRIFAFTESAWKSFNLASKLKFLSVLKGVRGIDIGHSWPNAGQVVPPPTLMYQLIVSTNLLILSEAFGYIAFLKTVSLPEHESKTLALRNTYVMDSINFVWREMALKKEPGTFSKGMFLDGEFLQRVAALNFFSYSNLIQLKTVGGIVQNPSLLYICAELVWMLEDQAEGITTRHPGPISEDTVTQLRRDPDNTWLSMSYYDIKISLLNSLDQLGYTGLCDLLFSSLKPLANKRQAA